MTDEAVETAASVERQRLAARILALLAERDAAVSRADTERELRTEALFWLAAILMTAPTNRALPLFSPRFLIVGRSGMLRDEHRQVMLVQAVAAKHAILSEDEAGYILWNETAYPFCSQSHMIGQVRALFGEVGG